MTIEIFLNNGIRKLVQAEIETARLDVLVLLEDCLHVGRAQILAHPEMVLTTEQLAVLDEWIARRVKHQPLAYIRGCAEFYGREFLVTSDVLVPRPESETMIDVLKDLVRRADIQTGTNGVQREKATSDTLNGSNDAATSFNFGSVGTEVAAKDDNEPPGSTTNQLDFDKNAADFTASFFKYLTSKVFSELVIGDVGAGSGALGITAVLELPGSRVELLEIDAAALTVAQQNSKKYELTLACTASDLLASAQLAHEVLLCNLPYVPDDFSINRAAEAEPKLALYGGVDGLDLYRRLFQQIDGLAHKPGLVLTESLPIQHVELAKIASDFSYKQVVHDDFIQVFTPAF